MNSLHDRLRDQLITENLSMDSLLDLIQQEQLMLIANNIKDMEYILDKKSEKIAELARLAHERHQMLASAGLQGDEAGMQVWLTQNPGGDVHVAWHQLTDKVKTAKTCNDTNGLLINTQLNRNQSTLNMLRGAQPATGFYGPNGQTTRSTLPRNRLAR